MSINPDKNSYPTTGQLERTISQKVRALYRNQFGHQPSKVYCHLLGNKLVLFIEDVITPIEKLLIEAQSSNLVLQVRTLLDRVIKSKLQELVEEISKVKVISCLYDTTLESGYGYGCAGAILIMANPPQVRPSKSSNNLPKF